MATKEKSSGLTLPVANKTDDTGSCLKPSAGTFPKVGATISNGEAKPSTEGFETSKKF